MTVRSSFFEYPGQGGPVTVSVLSNMDEKPDWTGLPSTTDEIEDGFDGNDVDEAVDEEGNGDDNDPRDSNGGDEEPGTRDVDDEGSNGDEEDDYGYRDLVDEADIVLPQLELVILRNLL